MEKVIGEEFAEAAMKITQAAYDSGYTAEEMLSFLETMQEMFKNHDFNRHAATYSRYNKRYTRNY